MVVRALKIGKEATEVLIKEWMNTHVNTVNENTAMAKASIIMKERRIRTLPVVNKAGRLVGIITDRDLKDASWTIKFRRFQ